MVPGLHNLITRIPPVTPQPAPYAARLHAQLAERVGHGLLPGDARRRRCCCACSPTQVRRASTCDTFKQLALADADHRLDARPGVPDELLGHDLDARAGAGRRPACAFPFFSAVLGWLGVFLTGSDTSANALFGNLQVVTANALGLNPVLTASVNSAAGVMGKMISVQSIAVAVAATGMTAADESRLFRFTIKHSVLLMMVDGHHLDALRVRVPRHRAGGAAQVGRASDR